MRRSGWGSRLPRLWVLVEEGEAAGGHSGCCTGGKGPGQSEPGAAAGFEAGQRIVSSGCGRASPEAGAWASGGVRDLDSGQGRRGEGRYAA